MNDTAPENTTQQLIGSADFDRICSLAFDYCGLNIEKGKEQLVSSRISKVMRRTGIRSFSEYYSYVVADKSQAALTEMIDALTTNHTAFFREQQHFDFLEKSVLPALAHRRTIDIWSAAASTGEEPYSLAMTMRECFGTEANRVRILATDISTKALRFAREATYPASRLAGVNPSRLKMHFLKGQGSADGLYRLKTEVRNMVSLQQFNLMSSSSPTEATFSLILCRNVMIYFDSPTQQQVVRSLYHHLEPGGYLFIGHSESLNCIDHPFEYVQPAIYRRSGSLAKAGPGRVALQ